eukprot:TRINITY_DN1795_c0_g1_i1.p2 TRINITY_DN1795_c0_g1~~TRINITY_DN1795_c0_g1_i1.p2  ORF type:complete len:58 (+),score=1.76 TRINITY_DN1795_c0_g1_i1:154-327(+)
MCKLCSPSWFAQIFRSIFVENAKIYVTCSHIGVYSQNIHRKYDSAKRSYVRMNSHEL